MISIRLVPVVAFALSAGLALAEPPVTSLPSDTPAHFTPNTDSFDYTKREVMIPMRDGMKLKTFILIPKSAKGVSMLLTRTPYNAAERVDRFDSPHLAASVPQMDDTAVAAGFGALAPKDTKGGMAHLVLGPWNHARVGARGAGSA